MKIDPASINVGFEYEFVYPATRRNHETAPSRVRSAFEKAGVLLQERSQVEYTSYQFTYDSSVHHHYDDEHHNDAEYFQGYEIVSPVMPLSSATTEFLKTRDIIQDLGGYTNPTSGCHWGISFDTETQRTITKSFPILIYNWTRLHEQKVLRLWDREHSDYTRSCTTYPSLFFHAFCKAVSHYKHSYTWSWSQTRMHLTREAFSQNDLIALALRFMPRNSRYYSLSPRVAGARAMVKYIECRAMGNTGYEDRIDDMMATINDYVNTVEVTLAGAGREEYVFSMIDASHRYFDAYYDTSHTCQSYSLDILTDLYSK